MTEHFGSGGNEQLPLPASPVFVLRLLTEAVNKPREACVEQTGQRNTRAGAAEEAEHAARFVLQKNARVCNVKGIRRAASSAHLTWACYATGIFVTLVRSVAFAPEVRSLNPAVLMTINPLYSPHNPSYF